MVVQCGYSLIRPIPIPIMKPIIPTTLRTARLILRPPVNADAAILERYLGDRRIAETTAAIPHPYPAGGALDWMRRVRQGQEDGSTAAFVICLKSTAEIVGVISLMRDGSGEMKAGYWIAVPFWGNGYATEAMHRVIRYGFNRLDLPRISACHFAHNPASGRVMQKAGLLFEGIQPQGSSRGDQLHDRASYGISAVEWRDYIQLFAHS